MRDLSISGPRIYLQVPRRQFYCVDCHRYSRENLEFADEERSYTHRYEEFVYQQVKQSSVEQVSRNESLSPDSIQGIFQRIVKPREAKKSPKGLEL
jgi:transposase